MATVTVMRYSEATTKAKLMREIANPDSRDHGTGTKFDGLVVGVLAGQQWARPEKPRWSRQHEKLIDESEYRSTDDLAAYIETQGISNQRTMWLFDVDQADIAGWAYRCQGGWQCPQILCDGICLRPGTAVVNVRKARA